MENENNIIREVIVSNEFETYFATLNQKLRDKYAYAMQIIKTQKVVSEKFVKKFKILNFMSCVFLPERTNIGQC
jgi:hypothetical protein